MCSGLVKLLDNLEPFSPECAKKFAFRYNGRLYAYEGNLLQSRNFWSSVAAKLINDDRPFQLQLVKSLQNKI